MNHLPPRPDPASAADSAALDAASALSTAALVALRAPALQPAPLWHWRIATDRVELYADERWRPRTGDPDGLRLLSCGTAVHHARIALRALGYLPAVRRMPDQTRTELLATVAAHKRIRVTPYATSLLAAAMARDTLPSAGAPTATGVPEAVLAALREAASGEGVWLEIFTPDRAAPLITALAGARRNGHHPERYAVLYGSGDRATAWLRAGEALSAVWLTAVLHGFAVRPLDRFSQSDAGRAELRRLTSVPGFPYLVLRVGPPVAVTAPVNGAARPVAPAIPEQAAPGSEAVPDSAATGSTSPGYRSG